MMTDINLGLVVSERDWIIKNELKLLQDAHNYKELSKIEVDAIMVTKSHHMLELAHMVDKHIGLSELGVDRCFKLLITDLDEYIYPQFHGIPKIHKKPTGFRPIILCHLVFSTQPPSSFQKSSSL